MKPFRILQIYPEVIAMATGEVFEVRVNGLMDGQVCNNVLHVRAEDPASNDAEDAANGVMNWWASSIKDVCSDEYTMLNATARQITPEVMDPYNSTDSPNKQGLLTGGALPSFCAIVLQQRTGFASRRKRGRIYLPGVSVNYVQDSVLTSAAITAIEAKLTTIMGNFPNGTNPFTLGVWSKTEWAASADVDAAFTPLTSIQINSIIGTQRRRRIGHGV